MYDPNNPNIGGMQQGFADYLQGQGWDGQGPMWQYAQQLRQQGQHPRMDYRQSLGFQMPQGGLGGLASGFGQNQMPGTDRFAPHQQMPGMWNQPPHTMTPGLPAYQGNPGPMPPGMGSPVPMGLEGLRKPSKFGLR